MEGPLNNNGGAYNNRDESIYGGGKSISPRLKSLQDFASPFKLSNLADPREEEVKKLAELREQKRLTFGLFRESVQEINDPG